MNIRKATLKDYEKLKQIKSEFYLWECNWDKRIDPAYLKRGFGSRLAKNLRDKTNKKTIFFVAEEKGEFLGYAGAEIEKNPGFTVHKKQGHLFNLYVRPKHRGEKIGERLTKEVLKWFKQKKLKDWRLMVFFDNKRAHNLYKKIGFKDYIIELRK